MSIQVISSGAKESWFVFEPSEAVVTIRAKQATDGARSVTVIDGQGTDISPKNDRFRLKANRTFFVLFEKKANVCCDGIMAVSRKGHATSHGYFSLRRKATPKSSAVLGWRSGLHFLKIIDPTVSPIAVEESHPAFWPLAMDVQPDSARGWGSFSVYVNVSMKNGGTTADRVPIACYLPNLHPSFYWGVAPTKSQRLAWIIVKQAPDNVSGNLIGHTDTITFCGGGIK